MSYNHRATTFFSQAEQDLNKSSSLLGLNCDMSTMPYYAVSHHAASVFYPVVNAVRMVKNLAKIGEGALLLIHALFNNPTEAIPRVLCGMVMELGSLVLNALNTIASVITFVTRTLSTICSLGYASANLYSALSSLDSRECDGRNAETTVGLALHEANELLSIADDQMYNSSLSL